MKADKSKSFYSTAEGQKQMFWDSHDVVAQSNQEKMKKISWDAGVKDKAAGIPMRCPTNPDYVAGYNSIN